MLLQSLKGFRILNNLEF